ncbi:hypothetical protein GCM10009856_41620 [Mycolicibacterium llatzerense]
MTGSQHADQCEVCILGAGIAGLNALVAAAQYLGSNDKVVLVDRRPRVGGMWVDTYDYVRLHQPYQLFTAGNIKWTLGKERGYLASKPEILDHLQHCLNVVSRQVDVDERFGWSYVSHEETDRGVQVTLQDPAGQTRLVEAKRLIKAFGFQVEPNPPLPVSSKRVRSTTPNDLGQVVESDAPVWIIGGGKTGLDTAHLLITRCPGREVNMVVGRGSIALRRDVLLPAGFRGRWFGGMPFTTLGAQLAKRYDGTNEDELLRWYYSTLGTGPTGEKCDFAYGFGGSRPTRRWQSSRAACAEPTTSVSLTRSTATVQQNSCSAAGEPTRCPKAPGWSTARDCCCVVRTRTSLLCPRQAAHCRYNSGRQPSPSRSKPPTS